MENVCLQNHQIFLKKPTCSFPVWIVTLTLAVLVSCSSNTESWTPKPDSVRDPLSELHHLIFIFMVLASTLISHFFLLCHLLCRIINTTLLSCLHIQTYSWFWYGYSWDNELTIYIQLFFTISTSLFACSPLSPVPPPSSLSLPYHSFCISFAFTPSLPLPSSSVSLWEMNWICKLLDVNE